MKERLKHPLLTFIVYHVIVAVISTLIVSAINTISFFESLVSVYNFVIDIIVAVFTYRVPVWMIILVIVGLVLSLYLYAKYLDVKEKVSNALTYTEDVIDDVRWVWNFYKGYDNVLEFKRNTPTPLCNS